MIKKLRKWYRKHHPKTINTEGIWYDRKNDVYEVYYYPSNLNKARVVGYYETLKEAELAKKVYTSAMKDIAQIIQKEA